MKRSLPIEEAEEVQEHDNRNDEGIEFANQLCLVDRVDFSQLPVNLITLH